MSSVWTEPTSKSAFWISALSLLVTVIFTTIGLVYYDRTGSALCLVFALENIVDFVSSAIVMWRFFIPGELTKEREEKLKGREVRASMAISFTLILLGIGVIASSSHDIVAGGAVNDAEIDIIMYLSLACLITLLMETAFKFRYAKMLESESLYKDGICSLIGTVLAAALFANTLIIKSHPELWWFDPSIAIVCGIAAIVFGVHSMYVAWKRDGIPIFTLSWWLMSRGDASFDKDVVDKTEHDDEDDDDVDDKIVKENDALNNSLSTNLSAEVV